MANAILRGAVAGAAGTTALNTATYLDMLVRGRPASSTPEETVKTVAGQAGAEIPGEGEEQQNRVSGAGPLLGILAGVGVGVAYGTARALGWRPSLPVATVVTGVAAMGASAAPMALAGVTDPRKWSAADWISDLVPHLAYGLVTAATCR